MSATVQTAVPAGTYVGDPIHSSFGFEIRHLGVSRFRSRFTDVAARLVSDGETLSLEGAAQADSVDISQPDFRAHVLADDFFDAERHPEIAFRSSAVRLDGEQAEVEGELTIKGITNHVVARGTVGAPITNPYGKTVVGLALETVVDRTAYGINWNMDLPGGKKALANDVKILVELELVAEEG